MLYILVIEISLFFLKLVCYWEKGCYCYFLIMNFWLILGEDNLELVFVDNRKVWKKRDVDW